MRKKAPTKRRKARRRAAPNLTITQLRSMRRNGPASDLNRMFDKQMAEAKAKKRAAAKKKPAAKKKAPKRTASGRFMKVKRPSSTYEAPRVVIPRRKSKPARGKWAKSRYAGAPISQLRSHSAPPAGARYGKRKSVRAKVGGRTLGTYLYRDRSGHLKKIPLHMILGEPSAAALKRRVATDERLARAVVAVKKRRDARAQKVLRGGDLFTPNAEVMTFEEWSNQMKANKRKAAPKRKRKRAKTTTKRTVKRRKKTTARKRSAARRRAAPKRRRTTAQRRKVTRKRSAAKRRTAPKRRRKAAKRTTSRRRRSATKRPVARRRRRVSVHQRRASSSLRKLGRGQRKRVIGRFIQNRRRSRYARRNQGWFETIKASAMQGLKIGIGFFGHKLASYALSEHVLTHVESLNTGEYAKYRGVLSDLIVAAVGIPMLVKHGADGRAAAVGMSLSVIQKLLVMGLKEAGQPEFAGYLASYPDASGAAWVQRVPGASGVGSYYLTPTGEYYQPTSGFGEYYQPTSGFGAYEQAAAGMGNVLQAAAAYEQAAAGVGLVEQAAAGMGAYFLTSPRGVGEYEQTEGLGASDRYLVDEGIHPDLVSAERALSVAEAAAGVGDVELVSTLNPGLISEPIDDAPRGSRAGTLGGQNGIFGSEY